MMMGLQTYFGLRKRERNGVMVLLCFIVITWSYPFVSDWLEKPKLSVYQQLWIEPDPVSTIPPSKIQKNARRPNPVALRSRDSNIQKRSSFKQIRLAAGEIELNGADSLTLMKLPGIGLVFASRIVRYRELLGGFYTPDQLLEVYGMDSSRYNRILPFLSVNRKDIVQIPVNRAEYDQLRRHPYIRGKYASLIIQYRKQHGAYIGLADLAQIRVFDEAFLRKIEPYLIFDL